MMNRDRLRAEFEASFLEVRKQIRAMKEARAQLLRSSQNTQSDGLVRHPWRQDLLGLPVIGSEPERPIYRTDIA